VPFGGLQTGPSPADRARPGSKHHLLTDATGVPLAVSVAGAKRNNVTQLLPLIDGVAAVTGNVGRPRQRAERWIVERTLAWLHNLRRLRTRYERRPELPLAFLRLGCAVVCQPMPAWD